ncbi:MAG: 3-phosphoserine/phosphohydroxythreonine transaminase [Lautropia sp.]|nr:3-phosphoserine/phosphohydroxythreonine transaminase [Lautropia sp.]
MRKLFNFSAGPAMLPEAVLQQAGEELLDWHGTGMSVMEMSHRAQDYMGIHAQAQANLRELLGIPEHYKVLFLGGGASLQFSALPLNLLPESGSADYIDTGIWSGKAIEEGRRYGNIRVAATGKPDRYTALPAPDSWQLDPSAAYVHLCTNETIGGVEFHQTPDVGEVPLVADMSSNILSRPIDVSRYGMIYAGAQKNIGPAGLTIVIIREDLLGRARRSTPSILSYQVQADNDSMPNTPPTYSIYLAGLVFQWLKAQGGLSAIEHKNIDKARLLYEAIDASDFYHSPVRPSDRSRMNVPFRLADDALNETFLKGAAERGLANLQGHRSVGGMRASIYNAMPRTGVEALVDYLHEFEKTRA